MSLGALVLTYNEEDMIESCLESIKWVDEIVIVDSFSDDSTISICRKYTDKIFQKEMNNFSSQRNFGINKITAEWILIVDADERIPKELKQEISTVISSDPEKKVFKFPRKNFFMGKWMKHCGWYPDYTVRLFYNISEHRYSGQVHETLSFKGEAGKLKTPLIHKTYKDINDFVDKINYYTDLAKENSSCPNLFVLFIRPILEFIKRYLFQLGFLSGKEGLILSMLLSYYSFLKYAKRCE
ncbi:glycosyltransferase family 2 protein [Halarsenatibacter silvermanii]|uniref:Glycosyltransferase involved in cell wall bisynthesis n=1 Tax=Halarsenatibacter silvermanii TaxID=321763 RepID=A0A1G9HZI1_9FIRM|nr:glycosyltransferase family 2 protein [Halarsenatibacter silvermanii]SDL18371.1 Glycosyltransferase involved in cell wall bisynthesis [Halarsenatibacter silvermanii]